MIPMTPSPPDTAPTTRRVALIGNPNVGKTTLFNHLTGLRQKVGNYPGVTVERKTGHMVGNDMIDLIDLPGSYSLSPKSLDERIAYDVLSGHLDGEARPDLVICVVDASVLERNLYLVSQVITGYRDHRGISQLVTQNNILHRPRGEHTGAIDRYADIFPGSPGRAEIDCRSR